MKKLVLLAIAALFVSPMVMAADVGVHIEDDVFIPPVITVEQGDSVTWTNLGLLVHTVTDTSGAFNSGDIAPGASWGYRFTVIGEYGYECTHSIGMVGTVIVTPMYTIPTMTIYGLGILALLLIGSTVWVLRRKRAGSVA